MNEDFCPFTVYELSDRDRFGGVNIGGSNWREAQLGKNTQCL